MTAPRLNVYFHMLTKTEFKVYSPQGQLSVYAAAPSQKRAAELFGVTSHEIRDYGGVSHNDKLNAIFLAEPETVFVQVGTSRYVRLTDVGVAEKEFDVDAMDEDLYGRRIDHAAFGMIDVSRMTGRTDLFQVDYPQEHVIQLTISTAHLTRRASNEHVMADREVVKVRMSEVQWARLIASPNTSGVPCTMHTYRDPVSGDLLRPHLPEKHVHDQSTFIDGVKRKTVLATESLEAARARVSEILKGPLRKGDLQDVLELLITAQREMGANLPYIVESAVETMDEATENAKTEVGAFIDFAMQRLGERVLGDQVRTALANGADLKAIGRAFADNFVATPALEDLREGDSDAA